MPEPLLPANLTMYLRNKGWVIESEGPVGQLWARGGDASVGVPFGLAQGDPEWPDVLRRVAAAMKLPANSVESAVLGLWRDELEFRVAGSTRVPLRLGSHLYRCVYTSFRAAATTAQGPKAFLRRQYSKVGDRLAAEAMFDQTREGSYVVPVGIELHASPRPRDALPFEAASEPPQRRVTRTLQESLSAIERLVIKPEHEPRKSETAALVSVGVSREMVASIEVVASSLDDGELTVTASWAAAVPSPRIDPTVTVPKEAAERLRTVAGYLKTAQPSKTENISGQIVSMDDDNRNPGAITIETVRRGRQCRVKIFLPDREQTEKAHKWFDTHETVIAYGHVHSASDEHPTMQPESVAPLSEVILPS